jgi:hypothetical protein
VQPFRLVCVLKHELWKERMEKTRQLEAEEIRKQRLFKARPYSGEV